MKIKKGDHVVIITGKDKGKKGNVIRTIPSEERIVVEKVNLCTKHQKRDQKSPGGKIQFEAPIHVSNVKIICPETKKSSRVRYERGKDGKKYRIAQISGVNIERPFVKS
ncbi:50S ribosomal protein L24 [Candidatus Peregrinibacteria bacterium]|nr:MAG: 50S ribosomal protein L24 [Candidatus Peregrinibacteria bacterium]